jgi:hypothetical protein
MQTIEILAPVDQRLTEAECRQENIDRDRRREEWAASEGLRESHATTEAVAWLLGKRGPRSTGRAGWFNHGTMWTKGGEPCHLLGQPYCLRGCDLLELARIMEMGLDVHVSTHPRSAWHMPGYVLAVHVTRPVGP